jgi:hypothetical protein
MEKVLSAAGLGTFVKCSDGVADSVRGLCGASRVVDMLAVYAPGRCRRLRRFLFAPNSMGSAYVFSCMYSRGTNTIKGVPEIRVCILVELRMASGGYHLGVSLEVFTGIHLEVLI